MQLGEQFSSQLAFKALTLNGQSVGSGLLLVVDMASLAADSVVMRDFPVGIISSLGGSITLDNIKVSGNGRPVAVPLPPSGDFTWSNVEFSDNKSSAVSMTPGPNSGGTPPRTTGTARYWTQCRGHDRPCQPDP